MRFNGWADAAGRSFVHAHPGNGTKAWIWGTSPNEQYWQRFGSANLHEPPTQNFTYTELQAGARVKGGTTVLCYAMLGRWRERTGCWDHQHHLPSIWHIGVVAAEPWRALLRRA